MENLIQCKTDVVFKYLLLHSEKLIRAIIDYVTPLTYQSLTIMNPNLLADYHQMKNIYLDIALRDDQGHPIGIEMQTSKLTQEQEERFQYYGSKKVTDQVQAGDQYIKLKPYYLIVFIEDKGDGEKLFEELTLKNEEGKTARNNLHHIIYVYLPNIDKYVNKKGIGALNQFEKIVYAFHYNLNESIIKVQDEVILEMKKNFELFMTTEDEAKEFIRARTGWEYVHEVTIQEKERLEKENKRITEENKMITEEKEMIAEEKESAIKWIMQHLNISYEEAIRMVKDEINEKSA